jgi:LysM repeat protein
MKPPAPRPPRVVERTPPESTPPSNPTKPEPRTKPKPEPRTKPKPEPATNVYEVKSGDTLGEIAKKNNVSLDKIMKLNPGLDPRRLQIGQKIRLK